MRCRHHQPQGLGKRPPRIRQEPGAARQRLVFFRVQHVQDHAGQQGMARLLPMVPPLQRAFRVDQDVGNVLCVPDFSFPAPHLQERIKPRALGICRIKADAV